MCDTLVCALCTMGDTIVLMVIEMSNTVLKLDNSPAAPVSAQQMIPVFEENVYGRFVFVDHVVTVVEFFEEKKAA